MELDLNTDSEDKVTHARVSSIDLRTGPSSDRHFLALAVDSDVVWPEDVTNPDPPEIMDINE